jgi:hypothetical protein
MMMMMMMMTMRTMMKITTTKYLVRLLTADDLPLTPPPSRAVAPGVGRRRRLARPRAGVQVRCILSIAATGAHRMTWCCIQKLCIVSGERQ